MSVIRRRAIFLAACVGSAVIALGVTACGDDDDDGGDGGDVEAIQLTASGARNDLSFEVDATEVPAGATELTLVNDSQAPVDGQLGFVPAGEDRSPEEVVDAFRSAVENRGVPGFFQAGGGPGVTEPGQSSSVTQDLEPGTYYVLPADDIPAPGDLASFEVTENGDGELPETEGKVSAVEYSFSGEGLKAGTNQILLENTGGQWHHFLASKLKDDATIEQAKTYLESEGGGGGPVPFEGNPEESNEIESTVMDPGFSQVIEADLEPGRYAFFCFIPDKQGGPPHVAKGMVSEVTVEE
jgi:uncharacterized cupredoxin-like copper-binding protein